MLYRYLIGHWWIQRIRRVFYHFDDLRPDRWMVHFRIQPNERNVKPQSMAKIKWFEEDAMHRQHLRNTAGFNYFDLTLSQSANQWMIFFLLLLRGSFCHCICSNFINRNVKLLRAKQTKKMRLYNDRVIIVRLERWEARRRSHILRQPEHFCLENKNCIKTKKP